MNVHTSRLCLCSPVFVQEADRWLSVLTLFLATHHRSLSSITLSSLPSTTRAYLATPHGDGDLDLNLDHIIEVAEWCLTIVAWGCGLPSSRVSYSVRVLDRVSLALMLDHEIGETLERWRVACEIFKLIIDTETV